MLIVHLLEYHLAVSLRYRSQELNVDSRYFLSGFICFLYDLTDTNAHHCQQDLLDLRIGHLNVRFLPPLVCEPLYIGGQGFIDRIVEL